MKKTRSYITDIQSGEMALADYFSTNTSYLKDLIVLKEVVSSYRPTRQ